MPLAFKLNTPITIKSTADALKLIQKVATLKIKDYQAQETPLEQIAHITTGESLFLPGDAKEFPIVASTGVSSCLLAYFYNSKGERSLLHFSADFRLRWAEVFSSFTDKNINFILIGATLADPSVEKSQNNLQDFFDSLTNYLNNAKKINVTLTQQKVLTRYNEAGLITQDAGFDKHGNVFDLSSIRIKLINIPVLPTPSPDEKPLEVKRVDASDLRNVRTHEAEHRAWLNRVFYRADIDEYIEKPDMLTLSLKTTEADITTDILFHKAIIDLACYLEESKNIDNYCELITNGHYGVKAIGATDVSKKYHNGLKDFLLFTLKYNETNTKTHQADLEKYPTAPYSPTLLSYKKNYRPYIKPSIDYNFKNDTAEKKTSQFSKKA